MSKRPNWRPGVAMYLLYLVVFVGTWVAVGADYANLVGRDVVFRSVVLPLVLGAILMVAGISWLGWWRQVMFEERRVGPVWTMWAVVAVMAAMIVTGLVATDWTALSAGHLALIALGGVLVGFNEEALHRGVLVTAFRGSMLSETRVFLLSTALFGLLHLPNAFLGIGLAGVAQVGFAFLAGAGFYVLRRVSGSLLLPMVMYGAWDFASFTRQASGAELPAIGLVFQFGTYAVAILAAMVLLRTNRQAVEP